jgi:hypothetical protein
MNSSISAPTGIANNDHLALVAYYEDLAKEAKTRLQENKKVLNAYENRPYFYGKEGLDLESHTLANIREYEKALRESLRYAELHKKIILERKKIAIKEQKNRTKVENSLNHTSMGEPEYLDNNRDL